MVRWKWTEILTIMILVSAVQTHSPSYLPVASEKSLFYIHLLNEVGRDNSLYNDSLLAGRSGDRIPVGAKFSAPVQTGPGPTQPPVQSVPGLSLLCYSELPAVKQTQKHAFSLDQ